MLIKKIEVENFRCLEKATLECDSLTILVGPNGVGKSTFLRALEVFYTPNFPITPDDFSNNQTQKPVKIRVTFGELTEAEKEQFKSYLRDEELVVEKVIKYSEEDNKFHSEYHGIVKGIKDFEDLRRLRTVSEKREKYTELRNIKYPELPDLGSSPTAERIDEELRNWENEHPDKLEEVIKEDQFYGFKEVATGYLGKYTQLIFVPAVKEASEEASEERKSAIFQLIDRLVNPILANSDEFRELQGETKRRYKELIDSDKFKKTVEDIQKNISNNMRYFAPLTQINLELNPPKEIEQFPHPAVEVRINEHGFQSTVDRCGHGTQRAFIFALLQEITRVKAQPTAGSESDKPIHYIICIEEPELYQHPSRQRNIMKRLSELAEIGKEERGERFQIIYSTHSPLLVNPSRFEQIRLFKREGDEDRLPETKIRKTSAKEICQKMGEELQENWNEETLIQKIQKIMNPFFNEGFFSELAVLVEGPTDRGVLLGMALTLGIDLEKHNIAVIPCNGKENLVLSALIFEEFGIKTYIIWDSDENAQTKDREKAIKTNKRLLRLCDATEEEDFPEMVHNDFACFGKEMDKKLKEEIGVSEFEQIMSIVKGEASLKHEDVYQNPELMQLFFKEALSRGKSCQFFQNIITKIIEKVKTK